MDNKIYMIYGRDPSSMTRSLLEAEDAASLIGDESSRIVIKPNFVIAGDPDDGATTHTGITVAVIEYLQDNGFENITVAEGSWVGSRTEDAFRMLEKYVTYVSSDPQTWEDAFLLIMSNVEESDTFRTGVARIYQLLEEWNEENMGTIELNSTIMTFIDVMTR